MTSLPVLVVEHEAQCPPGWMGEWLAEAGCLVDVCRPYAGDPLPQHLDDHRSVLVLGGSMDAGSDSRHPWLADVRQLVRSAARECVPVLGICLGHQLAAVALGGRVRRSPHGQRMGLEEMGWTAAAASDPLLGAVCSARRAVHWNNDVVSDLPTGAEVLARTADGAVQAARFAPTVWGVQCHPEAGAEVVGAWAANDRDCAAGRGVDVDQYVAQIAAARDELRTAWQPLAGALVAMERRAVGAW